MADWYDIGFKEGYGGGGQAPLADIGSAILGRTQAEMERKRKKREELEEERRKEEAELRKIEKEAEFKAKYEKPQPLYTLDIEGNLMELGQIPKGGKFITPKKKPETELTPLQTIQLEKSEIELKEKKKQLEFASNEVKESALDTLDTIKEVEKGINWFGAKGIIPPIPGTAQAKWRANVDKLLSGKIIDVMTTMKKASKTGATGFGQLNQKELQVLKDASTALKRTLKREDAQEILNKMKEKLSKIVGPTEEDTIPVEMPKIGETFMGGKVKSIKRMQ